MKVEERLISKAEKTRLLIIEKAAFYFNKYGYVGTSLSDLTKATGLTKGAIYGNFQNKEQLALEAFNLIVKNYHTELGNFLSKVDSPYEKLLLIFDFYSIEYYDYALGHGGCPILNIGVDTKAENPMLFERVNNLIDKLINRTKELIELSIESKEINLSIDSERYAKRIFATIEGAIFMAQMKKDKIYLKDMCLYLRAEFESYRN